MVRFLVQICEADQVYRADAMKKLEDNFKMTILRKIENRLERSDEISFVDIEYLVSTRPLDPDVGSL